MMNPKTSTKLLSYEAVGFGLVLALLWLDELADLPHLVFGAPPTPVNFAELAIETAAVLPLAILVGWATKRLLLRVRHLEGEMTVCFHCLRVRDREARRWVKIEDYVKEHSEAQVGEALCEDCALGRPPAG